MERIKGRPATGYPTLFVLDEFAGLKRMEAVAELAASFSRHDNVITAARRTGGYEAASWKACCQGGDWVGGIPAGAIHRINAGEVSGWERLSRTRRAGCLVITIVQTELTCSASDGEINNTQKCLLSRQNYALHNRKLAPTGRHVPL